MLSLRQVLAAVGLYCGLVVTAALVLNLRYKPVAGDAVYLDTWTGRMTAVPLALAEPAPNVPASAALASELQDYRSEIDRVRAEARRLAESTARARVEFHRHGHRYRHTDCAVVRFAFPAPETSVDR